MTLEVIELNHKNILLILLFLFCMGILIFNIIVLINWNVDRNKLMEDAKIIDDVLIVKEVDDSQDVELINPPDDTQTDYWYYINLPLTDVNIDDLKRINKDTIGFISVAGTNINYPVVQVKDNDYYLKHSFKKEKNNAGWIFMDYRNNQNFDDKNSIIYGHSRIDTTMFGTLKNILKTSWINNKDNYVIRYSSETENMLFQVFSVYLIPVETYYLQTEFASNEEYSNWITTLIGRSNHKFNILVDEDDKILTLSTCKDYSKNRVVMHAKLIKKDKKPNDEM